MGNNFYKILGATFMVISGLIYTVERIIEKLSDALVVAGYASHGTAIARTPHYPGFFDNFFVWFFFIHRFFATSLWVPKVQKIVRKN